MAKNKGDKSRKAEAGTGTETGGAAQNIGAGAEAGADYDAAYKLALAGRITEAEAVCRKILTSHPSHAEALQLLGGIAAKSGNAPSAIELFTRALEARPDFAKAHSNLGALLLGRGEAEAAVDHFEKANASEPDFAPAYTNLGTALMKSGRFADAATAFERAVQLEPDNALGYNNLGAVLLRQGREDEAIARFKKAIKLEPDLAMAHNNLGNALKEQGRLEEAVAIYRKALLIKPDFAMVHSNLGILLKDLGRYHEAEECLNRALDLKPDDTKTRYNHATVHKFVPGDPEIEKLKELLGRKGFSEDQRNPLLFSLGKAHDDIGRYAEAFSYYATANEENAGRTKFDASDHRKQIMAIKHLFRERHDSAGEGSGDAERVPIFVVGMSRSGKTFVGTLLSQHEDACGARESHEWPNAIKEVLDKHSIPGLFPNYMASLSDDHIREIGKIYMENLVENSPNSNLFIDTNPGNYRYIGMILQALPMAKIIYCHRDPIDNCLFVYFYRYARENYYSYDLSNLASYYADYQDIMAHWRRLYGDHIFSVRYEELVRNPTDIGSRIYQFYGLDYDATSVRCAFTTDEIGHWKHYESYLGPLRQALGGLAR